jgi:hypothetical protein
MEKMWMYVVTWCIVVMVMEPKVYYFDEFGRSSSSYGYETLENRIRYENDCNHERLFGNRDEAFAFYSRGINDNPANSVTQAGRLVNIKIDSIQVTLNDSINCRHITRDTVNWIQITTDTTATIIFKY